MIITEAGPFEKILQATVRQYAAWLDAVQGQAVNEKDIPSLQAEARKIHEPMRPLRLNFKGRNSIESFLIPEYEILHPDAAQIRWDMMPKEAKEAHREADFTRNKKDGIIEISYGKNDSQITYTHMHFQQGVYMHPRRGKTVWREFKGRPSDLVENVSDFGKVYGSLIESMKFYSARVIRLDKRKLPTDLAASIERDRLTQGLKIFPWQKEGEFHVLSLKVPIYVLGLGDLTAFFKHAKYDRLDNHYSSQTNTSKSLLFD
jgi:hypothetical protein